MLRITLIIISLFIFSNIQSFAQESPFQFREGSWKSAKKYAKKTDKLIFIQAMSKNCTACDKLEKGALMDQAVADVYNASFVLFKLDSNIENRSSIEKSLSVSTFPTSMFVDAKGQVIHKYVGAISNAEMLDMAKRVQAKKATLADYNKRYKLGPDNFSSDELYDYAKVLYYASMDYHTVAEAYFVRQTDDELGTPQNINAIILFTDDINSREFLFIARRSSNMTPESASYAQIQFKVEDIISNTIIDYAQQVKNVSLIEDSLNSIFNKYEIQNMNMVHSRVLLDYFEYVKPDNQKYFMVLPDYMNSHLTLMTASRIGDECRRVSLDCENREILEMAIQWMNVAIDEQPKNIDLYMISIDLFIKLERYGEVEDMAQRLLDTCGGEIENPEKVMMTINNKMESAMRQSK